MGDTKVPVERVERDRGRGRWIVRFLTFLIVYGLLIAPWPGLERVYADCFRAACNLVFIPILRDPTVRFAPARHREAPADADAPHGFQRHAVLDTNIELWSPRHPDRVGTFQTSSRHVGYLPAALVTALIVSSPGSLRRRGRALVWGLLLIQLYVGARLGILLLYLLGSNAEVGWFVAGPMGQRVLHDLYWLAVPSLGATYIGPLPLWILASFVLTRERPRSTPQAQPVLRRRGADLD